MTVGSLGLDGPDDVYSPHGKWRRGGHDIQRMWGSIDIVRERLTFMAFPYMGAAIAFHGELLITCSKDLLGHSMPIGMRSKRTLVDFLDVHWHGSKRTMMWFTSLASMFQLAPHGDLPYTEFRSRGKPTHCCAIEEERDGKPWSFDIKQ